MVVVKPLVWAQDRPNGEVRMQADGQIEFVTECGRYCIRERNHNGHTMFVARYLTNHVIGAHESLKQAKKIAEAHHYNIVLGDIETV